MFRKNKWLWSFYNEEEEENYKFYEINDVLPIIGNFTWVQQFVNKNLVIQGKPLA